MPEGVATLRRAARAYADEAGVSDPGAVEIVVSEIASNAVLHGYPGGDQDGEIRLSARMDADRGLEVVVADDGRGIGRSERPSPGLGLGLALAERLTRCLRVGEGPHGGTCVRMRFG